MAARRRRTPGAISALAVEGFKSLQTRQRIDIRPLTVLAGANSAGKSSIVQPLLLLKQTLEAPFDPGPLLLNGPNVSVTAIEQVLSRGPTRNEHATRFSVGIEIGGDIGSVELTFGRAGAGELRVLEMTGWVVMAGPDGDLLPMKRALIREGMTRQELDREFSDVYEAPYRPAWQLERYRCFLRILELVEPGEIGLIGPETPIDAITSVVHLPAHRGNPARTYQMVAVEDRFPGTFEVYTAGVIAAWQNRGQVELLERLRADLEELGLTWRVEARRIDDTQVELLVGRLPHARRGGARDLVNIADVGFGVSQTLPVLVALLAANEGQVVYLEQPEIHLHPRAQVAFARLLARAIERGARVLVETHSALLLRGLQTLVAEGTLSPDAVALHWFKRNAESGASEVVSGTLDPSGAYGDWPEDFDEVILSAEARYLDAAARRSDSTA